jgi:hypothetical protein
MSEETELLALPYIMSAQAQKHITHNEAIRRLDALVQLSLASRSQSYPPPSPNAGERHLVGAGSSGAWAGQDGSIAAWQDGAWMFYAPVAGWIAVVEDEASVIWFDGSLWQGISSGSGNGGGSGEGTIDQLLLLGINAQASPANRLAVASSNVLFTHEGDNQYLTMNKATQTDTTSLIFQDDFTGHAEMGLTGSNDFAFKTSGDGANWVTALSIDAASGLVQQNQRPSFRVTPSSNISVPALPGALPFGTVQSQKGSAYNASISRFTAPLGGLYHFNANVRLEAFPASQFLRLYFAKNTLADGFQLGHVIADAASTNGYTSLSVSAALELAQGDVITLNGGHASAGCVLSAESQWSGYFVG